MERIDSAAPLLHVFVCTNERDSGGLPSCAPAGGKALLSAFHRSVRARGLLGRVWITESGCLGWCAECSVTVAVYPGGHFYREVRPEDVDRIIERHLPR